jgi:hypothetical protein
MALQVGCVPKFIFMTLFICLKLQAEANSSSDVVVAQTSVQAQSKLKKALKKPTKSPWSGSFITDISRATDINHSKILDPENPEKRTDYSLAFIGSVSYKWDDKNTYSATEVITKDSVRNSTNDTKANEFSIKNLRLGWTRATDYTIADSRKIYLPFSIVLPTTSESRTMGSLGSIRFWPVVAWAINPKWTFMLSSSNVFSFSHPTTEAYGFDRIMQDALMTSSNSLILLAQVTGKLSLSQNLGITTVSKNLNHFLEMDQTGSSLNLSSGFSYMVTSNISIEGAVSQSSPIQGNGVGATKVYDDNMFRLYHIAQTNYALTGTYFF